MTQAQKTSEESVLQLIAAGEHEKQEFKSSLRWDGLNSKVNKDVEDAVVKTLAGFLNGKGGTLLIGVDDSGVVIGIAADYKTLRKKSRDGFRLHLGNLIAGKLGEAASSYPKVTFHEIDGKDVCEVTVEPSSDPIYAKVPNDKVFYLRTDNATRKLPVDEAVKYVRDRWKLSQEEEEHTRATQTKSPELPWWEVEGACQASYKLYQAVCLWVGVDPSWPLLNQRARDEYTSLMEAIESEKLGGDLAYEFGWMSGDVGDDEPSRVHELEIPREVLRKHIKSTGRPVPEFLKKRFDEKAAQCASS